MLHSGHATTINHDLTAAVVATTGPSQDWACQQSIIDLGGGHGALPIPVELLATGGFWEKAVIFFSHMPMGESTQLQRTSVQTDRPGQTLWITG